MEARSAEIRGHRFPHSAALHAGYDSDRVASFDHLVGDCEHSGRNGEAENLGDPQVDDELELDGLHHRQVAGLLALENPPDIDAALTKLFPVVGAIAHQAA